MRYSADHKAEVLQRLLSSSGELAKSGGFATTGVDGLMKAIGLSGGAFYSHFSSKQELFTAVIQNELESSPIARAIDSGQTDLPRLQQCLDQYLSLSHAQHPKAGCVLPALGAEIARADINVRTKVETSLSNCQKAWAGATSDSELAWGLMAQCVGALVLARMMQNEEIQKEILEASRALSKSLLDSRPPIVKTIEPT